MSMIPCSLSLIHHHHSSLSRLAIELDVKLMFEINSSDLISGTGIFEKFVIKHEENLKENLEAVQGWRVAMKEVGALLGRRRVNDEYDSLLPFSYTSSLSYLP